MDWQVFLHLTPYITSLAISAGVSLYAWRHRRVSGARPYVLCVLLQASWTLGYVIELTSPGLESKTFWDNTQFVGMLFAPMALLAFALEYTGNRLANPRRLWGGLTAVSLFFLALVFSDDLHGWVRPAAWLVTDAPFSALVYDYGPLAWVTFVYAYGVYLSAVLFLVRKLVYAQRLYRAQIGTILIGTLIPVIGTALTMVELTFTLHRDTTPFTFAAGNIVIAWGLFRHRLFDIVPVAREHVIEDMRDAVAVVDTQGRLVDLNRAAIEITGRPAPQVIGQPIARVFSDWPDLVGHYQAAREAQAERSADVMYGQRYFDLTVSPLHDRRDRLAGHLITMHDTTERVRAQDELKRYREHLEYLVQERTAEIHLALEQLQAEVSERTQAEQALQRSERLLNTILSATPIGIGRVQEHKLSWVNEAMCQILGWERAAFLGKSVRAIYPDDLEYERAGEELYTHFAETGFGQTEARLRRRDGTVVQCIVTMQALSAADAAAGHILAITDISERLRAEETLRQYAERLRVLHEIDRAILAAHAPKEIAQAAVARIRRLVPCPRASVILIDSVTRSARVAAVDAESEAVVPAGASMAFGAIGGWSREAGELLRQGQAYIVDDYTKDNKFNEKLHQDKARSLTLVPIRSQDELIGILSLATTNPAALSQENLDMARQVADQLAIAIQQASLRDQVQRHADELEQRVTDRTRELSVLYEVAALASQPLDLATILGRSLDHVLQVVDGEAGAIHVVDVDDVPATEGTSVKAVLRLLAHQGLPPDIAGEVKVLPADGGLIGWVIDHDEPLIVPDLTADPRTRGVFYMAPRTYVGVPLRAGGQALGVLSVVRRPDQDALSVEELSMLTSVADQLGTAVEGVRLHEQAERAAVLEERGRLARELHDSVTQLLYSINLFARAGRDAYSQGNAQGGSTNLAKLGETASQAIREMRLLLYELRPREWGGQGLVGAIQHRLDAVEGRAGIATQLLADADIGLPAGVEQELYHIVQEALNNALKHSAATSIKVQIQSDSKEIRLDVVDNGSGFDPQSIADSGGMGLANMRDRAGGLGGTLTILSAPGQGTTIRVSLKEPGGWATSEEAP